MYFVHVLTSDRNRYINVSGTFQWIRFSRMIVFGLLVYSKSMCRYFKSIP